MVRVVMDVDADGGLRLLDATGHARVLKGQVSVVCGAVSALLRSVAGLLLDAPGIDVSGEAPGAGVLRLSVERVATEQKEFLAGITALLIRSLEDVAGDEPDEVSLKINFS
ncbi:MAG: ribosomal-processing cysteine protease Prp [Spirochaetaceae bacterium]